jgi:hypothetical protein
MPNRFFSRVERLRTRLAGRGYSYEALRATQAVRETVVWATDHPIEMFNGNALRTRIVSEIVRRGSCSCFVETGTYHAATTIGAHKCLDIPVWSCEVSPRNYLISRIVTCGMAAVVLSNEDSRSFLLRVCSRLRTRSEATPFFYLDAHEDESDMMSLPLEEELSAVLALDTCVVMIDDVHVPTAGGFEAREYAGRVISVDMLRSLLVAKDIKTCYFPAYAASQDTGYPSGYCILWRSAQLDEAAARPTFPLNLLTPCLVG